MSALLEITAADLNALSLADLKALEKKVAKAIASFEERQRQEALAALEAKAKEMGFSLAELTGASAGRKAKPAGIPKFANPENPAQTWTGKGRRPEWFVAAVQAGKSPEDLAI
ncbi:H-NS histone family protein [Thalassobius sp. S69A]|uniref:H-NS histone family protein n=1 Tax=unclassified Thalassovita TaxID=2619711 RepID=UPI003C7DB510|tara:strand:- start:86 stop:424 length:339 start_codon:yes stop_codon:yes gene_type:complete